MTAKLLRPFFFSLWTLALSGTLAAQTLVPPCPVESGLKASRLYGAWSVLFIDPPAGFPASASLVLQQHHEFSESLQGVVTRVPPAGAARPWAAALAGDLEDGMLLLDESSNNINITATWNAEVVPGSCGSVFRGTWTDTSSSAPADGAATAFTLRKLP